ncbi:mechanosensitive ion channel family protein [Nitrosopumilus maritimus]|uniref:MscS Mechanosensitive ion channel n=1 Tax=Nitrosopumilus maritimus (strain SCM1) TaxID=436308 RepID=A9A2J2_NITMS|nr:mechanosensitive ion channel family protein [Nitrosopumilus maritimus]ABX13231.1 MscS Mechanosensitive ion channel [Nitrosopumilus maritimus SCM1]
MVLEFLDQYSFDILGNTIGLGLVATSLVFLLAGFTIASISKSVFTKKFASKLPEHTSKNIGKLLYYGIILLSFAGVMTSTGIDLSGLLVAGGIFGVVIGFATQSVVSNLISGIFLMIEKPLKHGDTIEIPDMDVLGTVLDITMFSTMVRKFDGTTMRIPNDKVFTSRIRGFSSTNARRTSVSVGISYSANTKKAISKLKQTLNEKMPYILAKPEPEIHVTELADSSVNLQVMVWHHRDHWGKVYPELCEVVKTTLDENGIEIPFPQRVVEIHNKN